ncbi:AraC family transcriptional regulator [Flavobacterium subsaxonicum]|uniref:AraC family transcriptional regulator n=1 Tax=Flavobacterium subsaxonicum WB 4.1-42 = DSM 21790 TaxID=1121898 RepID=A0A0A2MTA9_9FLAO|nr:helix-turn-helix transcriptional regulator [Flavobacterium subsaxonicum]KGO94678.1 AraC family transcriptional regulator [Flavobacterium subsaxonicum WB 4.1-42 = DSM 21790]
MPKKTKSIPVNTLPLGVREGIIIGRRSFNGSPNFEEVERSHRDGGYSFIIQEKGATRIEIDFQTHAIEAPSLIYIHPNQVHRVIAFKNATITSWIITLENLRPEYLKLLDDLAPANVLPLTIETFLILSEMASVCMKLCERSHEKLYDAILRESCNTLVALVASQYLAFTKPTGNYSRFDVISKAFKSMLEHNFRTVKSPTAFAGLLNISVPYLNECIKATTGNSVSYHIQHRIVLEAKRLIYHSDKSIKEIAIELGYDDYSYFTRLFNRISGMTPTAFRNRNLD